MLPNKSDKDYSIMPAISRIHRVTAEPGYTSGSTTLHLEWSVEGHEGLFHYSMVIRAGSSIGRVAEQMHAMSVQLLAANASL